MTARRTLKLFDGVGVEIEYMIVDGESLALVPISDRLLQGVAALPDAVVDEPEAGAFPSEVALVELAWSNELVLHVVELKTNGPAAGLGGLGAAFHRGVRQVEALLEPLGARLMPTAMHPLMNPERDTRLWPHEYSEVYATFDRIFDCRGHGWSNLQSVHINLPFDGDEEFARLHGAIRLVLPLLPALSASSPMVEGVLTGICDNRLEYYRTNCQRIPSVTGRLIPEPISTRQEYEQRVLRPIARDVGPFDPNGILDPEWVNARGAIARFSRGSIEIRVLDVQECVAADLAIIEAVVQLLRLIAEEQWMTSSDQRLFPTERLKVLFRTLTLAGSSAVIDDAAYLAALGIDPPDPLTARELWATLFDQLGRRGLLSSEAAGPLEVYAAEGTLAERIVARLPPAPGQDSIVAVYRELCECLRFDRSFRAE